MRPVLHRASTVEIIVPYGDPRAPFHKKCAFDVVSEAPEKSHPCPACPGLATPRWKLRFIDNNNIVFFL